VLEDQGWTDSFVTGDEFSSYLDEESQRVESVLSELGLA
jgi:putative tricarboxylic transport membrane protein